MEAGRKVAGGLVMNRLSTMFLLYIHFTDISNNTTPTNSNLWITAQWFTYMKLIQQDMHDNTPETLN